MARTTEGRILDKDFENEMNSTIQGHVNNAQKAVQEKQSQFEDMVAEKPFEFVIGAFIGGLLIGALLSKKG